MKKIYYIFLITLSLSIAPQTALTADDITPARQPLPTGSLNPALIGIRAIRVAVFPPNAVLGADNILSANMKAAVERKLAESDPRLAALLQQGYNSAFLDPPFIRINISKFSLIPAGNPVFSVQTTFSANVPLESNAFTFMRADVWSRMDTTQAPNINAEIAAVMSLISKHIDEFVKDFSLANAAPVLPAEPNNIKITTPQPQPIAKPKTSDSANATPDREAKPQPPPTDNQAQHDYVSSKNSKIFHKPDCTWTKNILPKNQIFYKTRDEAIAAGKQPCKKCQP